MTKRFLNIHQNKPIIEKKRLKNRFLVRLQRLELWTQWLRVICSTNWAKGAYSTFGAGDEIRTRDVHLGKVTLYHWATPALSFAFGADEETRTPMSLTLDPKSSASANSATSAYFPFLVTHPGFEHGTPWLKVMCSTDWANGSSLCYNISKYPINQAFCYTLLKNFRPTCIKFFALAGVEGFEPSSAGVRVQCLNHLATPQWYWQG